MEPGSHERGREVRPRVLILLGVGLLALPGSAQAGTTTGRLLVTLDRSASGRAHAAAVDAVVARAGAHRAGATVPQIGLVTVRPRPGQSLRALAARLRADPDVHAVQAERRFGLRGMPDDPALSMQEPAPGAPPGTPIEWWAARENLLSAWDATTGEGATVAVIDTGIDASHPEFAGRISGTVDLDSDTHDGPGMTDTLGHGTHVASLACATGNNGIGLVGAGYRCSLLVIKSDLSDSSVASALVTAADRGADAINMSFGNDDSGTPPEALVRAVDYAYDKGVTMVAAAADTPIVQQGDPANILQPTGTGPHLGEGKGLSVTAADFVGTRASFAGLGTQISMAAFGSFDVPNGPRGIFGAFPATLSGLETGQDGSPCFCRTTFLGDPRYAYVRGTSMATPMVAAVAALVHHVNPALGAGDVIRILKRTAQRPPGTGWNRDLGWGILDGGAAIAGARAVDRTPPSSRLTAPATVHGSSFTLRWHGTDGGPTGVLRSGIARYEVFRGTHGAKATRIATTTGTTMRVHATAGARYAFFTIAVDHAGNVERRPSKPDAVTRVAAR